MSEGWYVSEEGELKKRERFCMIDSGYDLYCCHVTHWLTLFHNILISRWQKSERNWPFLC